MASDVTPAHQQSLTLHLITNIPEHEPRESDPHYGAFLQAKARLKRQGLWKCVIGDDLCGGQVELHHSHIEFSQINATDLDKVNAALGLDLADDAAFQAWVEGPGNLEPLCATHHRTSFGIHVLPGPLWEPLRYRKVGSLPSAKFIPASQLPGKHKDDPAPGSQPG